MISGNFQRLNHNLSIINHIFNNYFEKYFFSLNLNNESLFQIEKAKKTLDFLKKEINKETTLTDFQAKVVFLNVFIIDSINTTLILRILDQIDENLRFGHETRAIKQIFEKYLKKDTPSELKKVAKRFGNPMNSLNLLRKLLLVLKIHSTIIKSWKIKKLEELKNKETKIFKKISEEFECFYRYNMFNENFKHKEYFEQEINKIDSATRILKKFNKFRSGSAAHGFSKKEYAKFLKIIECSENDSFDKIYLKTIEKISLDIHSLLFRLRPSFPPIYEYNKLYLEQCLKNLRKNSYGYESEFLEIADSINDFPELLPKTERELLKLIKEKENDSKFIIELGFFIELVSYSIKDSAQKLINFVLIGHKFSPDNTIAHIGHILKNSKNIQEPFFDKIYPVLLKSAISDNENEKWAAQWVLWVLIDRFPKIVNKNKIKKHLKNEEITYSLLKSEIK